jgi:hypothetical protein
MQFLFLLEGNIVGEKKLQRKSKSSLIGMDPVEI